MNPNLINSLTLNEVVKYILNGNIDCPEYVKELATEYEENEIIKEQFNGYVDECISIKTNIEIAYTKCESLIVLLDRLLSNSSKVKKADLDELQEKAHDILEELQIDFPDAYF